MATNLSALKINPLKKSLNPLGALTWAGTTQPTPIPFSPSYDPVQSALSHQKELQSKIDEHVAKQSEPTGLPALDFSSAITWETAKQQFTKALAPTPTGGGFMPPTKEAKPLPTRPEEAGIMDSIIPKASAMSEEEIGSKIDSGEYDDLIKQLANEGYSPEDITQALKDELATVPSETAAPAKEEPWFLKSVWQWIQNIVGWAVSEVPKIAWNVLDVAAKMSPWYYLYWKPEEALWWGKTGKVGKEFVQKYGAYEPDSTGAKVWEIGADIAATLVWPSKFFKTAEWASTAIRWLAWLANASLDWTIAAVQNYAATEWRLPTAKEVKNFIITSTALKWIWKAAEKLSSIPTAKVVPTTITEAGRDIQKWLDIWKTIRDTGISLTKSSLMKKIDEKVKWLSDDVDSAIQSVVKEKWPSNVTINDITSGLKERIMNNPEYKKKLQWTPIDMADIQEWIDETIDSYKKLFGKKKIPLWEQQQLKKDIYSWLSATFKKSDTAKLSARQVAEKEIAKTLKEWIEDKVPEVKALNEQLSPLLEAGWRLKAKWAYSSYLTDIIAGWFASGNPTTILQDPVWYAKNFAVGVLVKRLWTSTAAKTTVATILNNMNKLFENKIFIRAVQNQAKSLYSNNK